VSLCVLVLFFCYDYYVNPFFRGSGFTSSWRFASGYSATVNGFVLDFITERLAQVNLATLTPIAITTSKSKNISNK